MTQLLTAVQPCIGQPQKNGSPEHHVMFLGFRFFGAHI
ncbi:hypothetical protein PRIO_2688 [Paenibacillus riograndensis SBR5]|uniref:Uncharacterized protein n=1 Tax=Paenibacillus riograndensis SBR5 TaxID=1073571 RepID=A0A0E4CWB1_9BACL|nr:hypothetical protein PRIO_2688 [Paenibacillus riograndensis SBR5]